MGAIPRRTKVRRTRGLVLACVLIAWAIQAFVRVALDHYRPGSFPVLYAVGILCLALAALILDRLAALAQRERRKAYVKARFRGFCATAQSDRAAARARWPWMEVW